MSSTLKYVPVFRARQQEILVLKETDFGNSIYPMVEVIKEKDRKNNQQSSFEIYSDLIGSISSDYVFLSLPNYIKLSNSTQSDVVTFSRIVLESVSGRVDFLGQFRAIERVVPVISSLLNLLGEADTIRRQSEELVGKYSKIAYMTSPDSFEEDLVEIEQFIRNGSDFFIYDLGTVSPTNPIFRKHNRVLRDRFKSVTKIIIRSALNSDIKNVELDHNDVISEADNSLIESFERELFDAFGDYAGIKKDDMSAGGTISPGFIFYDPYDNLYYGFKAEVKKLEQFKDFIVPAVLGSAAYNRLDHDYSTFVEGNPGVQMLRDILSGVENGKNQAKFKKIAMLHYLHCMKVWIDEGRTIPLYQE
ncbi:beta family protein [Algoriphagus aquimarinus]|uniref:Uncharacterized protein n=1 Tax=Algoriphagus aquimarinus TaxID=237018 RepID=A0A5C7AGG2_9BACT|nr:hypothetical protein [Algoriphagus aquimarinus]TXE03078.1 hypothetical protein ESV85_20660 [Algoriphagus aquimarinus]